MRKLGLYIHIPFCASKCAYCDFYSLAGAGALMDGYADALITQLEAFAPRAAAYAVDTVYVGGGTPSYLGAARLVRILQAVRGLYAVAPGAEITLEANPDSVGDWFAELRAAGYRRVSLGVQSFDDALLRAVGRVHTARQAADAVGTLRRAGFENLSLDLIYGLPGETARSWRESVERAMALSPEHMSCYGLKVEPGTPLSKRRDLAFPDDDAQAERYLRTTERLSRGGWRQYEISNFAKPGMESRHNLKYWTLGEYLGFGPGAHSDFGGERFAWARDLRGFIAESAAARARSESGVGAWTRSESSAISPQERAREWLMLGLRTSDGVSLSECAARFGRAFDAGFLSQCVKAGYAVTDGGRLSLTARGFLVSNQIIGFLLDSAANGSDPKF